MKFKTVLSFFIIGFSLISVNSYAGIMLNGTRLIFNGNKNESSITITNPDTKPYLIQSWVSLDDKKSSEFIVTPPLFRMEADSTNALRVVLTKNNLPQTQESLFWLNVKAIPPSDPNAKESLLIALNTKIKLIYRPAALIGPDSQTAYQKLTFTVDKQKHQIVASNPTAYYVNLSTLSDNGQAISNPGFIAPFSSMSWKVKPSSNNKIEWSAINDFGGFTAMMTQQIN